ncbi:MAG: aminotransferase class III-fold pyridoxal phosphate-dependent enzyme [Spirochaetia bacterium]
MRHGNEKTADLYRRAKSIIPGGTQLLSKRPEMFAPEVWPAYYSKAEGCTVWDLDGNSYIDMSTMGIGSCLLGYADPDVNGAVIKAVREATMSTLNSPDEVYLGELLLELHPWAEMVRYARSGGEMMAAAVRIARAASGKDHVAICGYHGWHDWYLAANLGTQDLLDGQLLPGLEPKGVPRGLSGTVHPFHYNKIEEVDDIFSRFGSDLGVLVMEPVRYQEPSDGFLEKIRTKAQKNGTVLIFDEITAGWRHCIGGQHMKYAIEPDMAVFAKALSNGVPMAAVIGTRSVMDAAQESFISSTYWTDRTGPAAALAAVKKYRSMDIPDCVDEIGAQVQAVWKETAGSCGLDIEISGAPALSHFTFKDGNGAALSTFLTQELLEKGILGNTAFYASAGHTPDAVEKYAEAFNEIFPRIKRAADSGNVGSMLKGPVKQSGFTRLT